MDDASTAITWAALHNKFKNIFTKNEQKQVSIKYFKKRNLAHLGMAQCMNALADKVRTQTRIAVHAVIGTKFTATYVGMVVEECGHMLWSAYHCVHGTSCLCTSSASAFMH